MGRSKHTPAAQGGKWLWPTTRKAIYLRDGEECAYCGSPEHLTVDHYHPVERGGTNKVANLLTCCLSCNSSKGSLHPRSWWARLRERMPQEEVDFRLRRAARLRKKPLKKYRLMARRMQCLSDS
jgi:5-methylcytosine-specific restriction endonuclease McrA